MTSASAHATRSLAVRAAIAERAGSGPGCWQGTGTMTGMAKAADRWHRWLMDERFGGDPAARERLLPELLYPVRDTVLDKAGLQPGDTVLDVGTGTA